MALLSPVVASGLCLLHVCDYFVYATRPNFSGVHHKSECKWKEKTLQSKSHVAAVLQKWSVAECDHTADDTHAELNVSLGWL